MPASWAEGLAFATAVLFALHPVHVEAVTWLTGRKDVLCGFFTLATLLCAWRWREPAMATRSSMLPWALACAALALLSKPTAVVLVLLVLLPDYVCGSAFPGWGTWLRERAALYLGLGALTLAYLAIYWRFVPVDTNAGSDLTARMFVGPGYARWGQQLAAFLWLALSPSRLAPIFPPDLLDSALLSPRGLLGWAVLGVFAAGSAYAVARRAPLGLAFGTFVLPLLPVLVTPPWAQYVRGRWLHQGVCGVLLALCWLAAHLLVTRPQLRRVAYLAAATFAAKRTWGSPGCWSHAACRMRRWSCTRHGWTVAMPGSRRSRRMGTSR